MWVVPVPNLYRFEHLRNEIDWGLNHDPSACIGYAALELGCRGFVPVSSLTVRCCQDDFGGSWAALSQVSTRRVRQHGTLMSEETVKQTENVRVPVRPSCRAHAETNGVKSHRHYGAFLCRSARYLRENSRQTPLQRCWRCCPTPPTGWGSCRDDRLGS